MSRVAKKSITLPSSVKIEDFPDAYLVSGDKGSLFVPKFDGITIAVDDNVVSLYKNITNKNTSASAGLFRSLLSNAIEGVSKGFQKTLVLKGLGFRCNMENNTLVMSLGYSHKVHYVIPDNISVKIEKDTIITISGYDKQHVGQISAEIRSKKIPDNYHGKGILYHDETILLKEGKKK